MSVNVRPRRRLEDLYVVGKEVTLDDGQGDPVVVWLQKLSPPDIKQAMTLAHSARSKLTALRGVGDQDERRAAFISNADFEGVTENREEMIGYLIQEDMNKAQLSRESEVSFKDEWKKNDYLEGLRRAWLDELAEVHMKDPTNEEATKVLHELERYHAQVDKLVNQDRKRLLREYDTESDEDIFRKVIDQVIEAEADGVWIDAFRDHQLLYAVRDPDEHGTRYFDSVESVRLLHPEVKGQLLNALDELMVELSEGKD